MVTLFQIGIGDSKGGAWGAMAPPAENYVLRNLGKGCSIDWQRLYRLALLVLAFFMFLASILSHF